MTLCTWVSTREEEDEGKHKGIPLCPASLSRGLKRLNLREVNAV